MNCGLESYEIQKIKNILQEYNEVKSACIFGSRARGNFKPTSDVDIAIKGDIDIKSLAKIKEDLSSSSLPYFFDVIRYDKAEAALRQNIDKEHLNLS